MQSQRPISESQKKPILFFKPYKLAVIGPDPYFGNEMFNVYIAYNHINGGEALFKHKTTLKEKVLPELIPAFNKNLNSEYQFDQLPDVVNHHLCLILRKKNGFFDEDNNQHYIDIAKLMCSTLIDPREFIIKFLSALLDEYLENIKKRIQLDFDEKSDIIKNFSLNLFHSAIDSSFSAEHKQVAANTLKECLQRFKYYGSSDFCLSSPMRELTLNEKLPEYIYSQFIYYSAEKNRKSLFKNSSTFSSTLQDGDLGKIFDLCQDFISYYLKYGTPAILEIKKNARLIAQGARTPQCLFATLPEELNIKIAALTGGCNSYSDDQCLDVANRFYKSKIE